MIGSAPGEAVEGHSTDRGQAQGCPEAASPACPAGAEARTILTALGALSALSFSKGDTAIGAYLDLIMELVGVPSAFVSQIAAGRMWVIDSHDRDGCAIPSDGVVPLEQTFCQYVSARDVPVVIADAARDPRVMAVSTRVDYSIAAYAGVPIHLSDGTLYGTLCALDTQPRDFSPAQVDALRIAGRLIGEVVERQRIFRVFVDSQHEHQQDLGAALAVLDQQAAILGVVAHDLRSPLTSINGYVRVLLANLLGPVGDRQREALDHVSQAAQLMNRLINDLLDAARLEAQTFTLVSNAFDPRQLARQALDTCAGEAARRGLALELRCPTQLPTVVGDPERVQQVLLNLLGNALRYTSEGAVRLALVAGGDTIEFRVEDSGPGIAPEDQARIWQRYARATQEGKGLGLGLYIAQQLVEAMGGSIGLQSTLGQGSAFWVRLPLQGPPPQQPRWS
jgi:signal transduction histidine kinase